MLNIYELVLSDTIHFKQLKVKDLLFTHYHCPQDNDMLGVYSHYNFITYTISGERIIQRPGKSFRLTKGKCLFVKKGAYRQQRLYDSGWCVLVFFMPDSYLKKFINEYRAQLPLKNIPQQSQDLIFEIDVNETTNGFFYSMLPYFMQSETPSEDLIELKFRELVFNILSNPANAHVLSCFCSMCDYAKPSLPEIMESNYMFHLSLQEFSKITQRSLASFKREFNLVFKTTPGKWLIQKRLQHAQLLLETSHKSINEIAYESGFENNTHFSKIFKAKFGVSPLKYRNKNLGY
jgi:AraC-like DNA-binding protein